MQPKLAFVVALALVLTLAVLVPPAAHAEPFGFDTLFSGRSVKQSVESRDWEAGLRFEIAPVRSFAKEGLQAYVDAHPEIHPVYVYLQQLDDQILSSGTADEIANALLALDGLGDQDRVAINTALQSGDPGTVAAVVDGIHGVAPLLSDEEDAVAFAVSPYFLYNFKYIQLGLEIPLAGFATSTDTDFTIGNVNLDARFGHHFGDTVAFGFSYGAAIYLPTGGERADNVVTLNTLESPRFLHNYLTLAPYFVAGVDLLGWVKVQAHLEILDLLGVRGNPENSVGVALRWGTSVIVSVFDVFAINVELDGAESLKDAPAFEALYLTGGLRANIFGFQLGAAVQTPLNLVTGSGREDATEAVANAAEINVIVTAAFEW